MEKESVTSALLIRYLLGSLSAPELEQVEQQFFNDDDFFCELLETEDQLIEEYLDGQLSADEREKFKRHFLALPVRRRKVEITSLLKRTSLQNSLAGQPHIETQTNPALWWQKIVATLRLNQPVFGFSVAAALLLVAFGVLLMTRQHSRTPDNSQVTVLASPSPAASATAPRVVSLLLLPGSFRGGSASRTNNAKIGAGTEAVELKLQAGAEHFSGYQASLQNKLDPQRDILTTDLLKTEAGENGRPLVIWTIPASQLPVGDYQVTLRGKSAKNTSAVGEIYDFTVRHL